MTAEQPNFDDREFLISRYLDGDLPEAQRREVERALRDDPAWADLLESYRRTDTLIRSLRDSGPELDWQRFAREVHRRREAADVRRRRLLWYRVYTPLASAAVIALMCTAYFLVPPESPAPSAPVPVAIVQISGPAGTVAGVRTGRVADVRWERTPPPGFSIAPPSGKSYVIAAAGAKPFDHAAGTQEQDPYF